MARPRTNDPLHVSDNPRVAADTQRVAELVEEFELGLACIKRSYLGVKAHQIGSLKEYNSSLARLKKAVAATSKVGGAAKKRIHPLLELRITNKARELGGLDPSMMLGREHEELMQRAARYVARTAKPRSHRPDNAALCYHVEALMVLIQQYHGRPIVPRRSRNEEYEPHFDDVGGKILEAFFTNVDPSVTTTALVNMALKARRKLKGKPLDFDRQFPFMRSKVDWDKGTIMIRGQEHRFEFHPAAPMLLSLTSA